MSCESLNVRLPVYLIKCNLKQHCQFWIISSYSVINYAGQMLANFTLWCCIN